jgi:N-acyl-D-aspartate/D-glutamate deacylase
MNYDLIIRNGTVYDGTGAAPRRGDIAVQGGKIAEIADTIDATANEEIDAAGMAVTPGFVDVHTHYDGQATWDNHLTPSSNLGTTTVVMGNCGVGFAPCRPEDRNVLVQLMEGVEEIPGTALAAGIPWTWESFPDYMRELDAIERDIDIAAFIPHGPLRVYVMGARGVNREAANKDDIEHMKELVRESLKAGAIGLSSSRTLLHLSSSGANVPTFDAAASEMKALGSVLDGAHGHVMQFISDWQDAEEEFDILRETARTTGAKGTFTLIPIENPSEGMNEDPDLWRAQLKRIEAAQADGLDIRGQVISRPIGILMGHPASMSPFYKRPSYLALADLPAAEKATKLKAPETKARILAEENDNPHIFVQLLSQNFGAMYPMENPIEYLPNNENSVAARAAAEGRDPQEWLYDFLADNEAQNLIYIPATSKSKDKIGELLKHPHTVEALGDGGAHVGSICDTSANLFVLTKWVFDEQLFPLEEGIRMITSEPAEFFSFHDRGRLDIGLKADMNIIDFDNLRLKTPHMVDDLPGGGARFVQNSDGIIATFVAGQKIFDNGQATGALPGRLVKSPIADMPQAAE